MIKINLLDSVTERQSGAVVAVERRIASPASKMLLMTISVAFLLAAVVGWDVISSQMAKADAEAQLAEQQQVAAELEAVTKEMKELEAKIQNIDSRIDMIKKLRGSQAGPSAVLEAMRERIAMTPGIYLESIEQTGDQLTIKGNSPDEAAVTQFGRSLEFSSGLFSNLNIETQRKDAVNQPISTNPDAPKETIVGFSIRCAYTPSKGGASKDSSPMVASTTMPPPAPVAPANAAPVNNQPAPTNAAAPPQVAKN